MNYDAESFKAGFALGRVLWRPPIPEEAPPPSYGPYLLFESDTGSDFTLFRYPWNSMFLEYSFDTVVWNTLGYSSVGSRNGKIYVRGTNNTRISSYNGGEFRLRTTDDSKIRCVGNVETLLDYETVLNGGHPVMDDEAFSCLFRNCSALISGPDLPSTILTPRCYSHMFDGCTSLVEAPDLPATILSSGCYVGMFIGCTSLVIPPKLLAETLVFDCYRDMFAGCSSLIKAPRLPALVMADRCYSNMFSGCTSLVTPPTLPANVLATECYRAMFNKCTSLSSLPKLSALNLADGCYMQMFLNTNISLRWSIDVNHPYEFRIPYFGDGIDAYNTTWEMTASGDLDNVWWPAINTTYYSNLPTI